MEEAKTNMQHYQDYKENNKCKTCIVIIPALNEEKTIGNIIDKIPKYAFYETVKFEVLVINDGSTDNTEKIAIDCGASVISNLLPEGVGSAFWKGVCEALRIRADYMVNIDGDGQMDPLDIEKLLKPIIEEKADMVTASRFIDKEAIPKMPKIKLWGNQQVAKIVSNITGRKYYDVSCGFRAYNRETLLRLNLHGKFTYTQETFLNLANKRGIRIQEIPISIRGEREFGKSRVASNIIRYAYKSGSIILKAFKDYQPVKLFGGTAVIFSIIALIFESIFFAHFFVTGLFSGFLWAGLSGAFCFILAVLCLILMIVSDTLSKQIMLQEEILYHCKKTEYYK